MKGFRHKLIVFGLALLVGCQSGAPPNPPPTSGPTVIPETTKVADAATRDALVSYDPVTGILIFAAETPVLSSLAVGDVFASDVIGAKAASGFLRKVTAKRSESGQVVLETRPVLLEEAVQTGRLVIEQSLRPEDEVTMLVEGVEVRALEPSELTTQASKTFAKEFFIPPDTELDFRSSSGNTVKVKFNGFIKVGATISGDVDIGFFDINSFSAKVTVFEETKLEVSANASLTGTARLNIATIPLGTYTFFIGPVPVVVNAELIFSIGADGKVAADVTTTATQNLSATVGIKYDEDDGWSPIKAFESSFDFEVKAGANFEARAYVGAQAGLSLYGVLGAGFETKAFVRTIVKIPNDPVWVLEGGVDLSAVLEADFPIIGELRYEKKLGEFKKEIGRSENSAPEIGLTLRETELELNEATFLGASVSDREGNCCKSVVWTSDKDGILGESNNITYTFKSLGARTITVTATDEAGKSSSKTASVNVVNSPPELGIGGYDRNWVRATQAQNFTVRVSDRNERIDCSAVVWEVPPGVKLVKNGCKALATYENPGDSWIRVSVKDSIGAISTQTENFIVGEAPENRIDLTASFGEWLPVKKVVGQNHIIQYLGYQRQSLFVNAVAEDKLGRELAYEFFITFGKGSDDGVAGKTFVLYETILSPPNRSIDVYNISFNPSLSSIYGDNPAVLGIRVFDPKAPMGEGAVIQFDIVISGYLD